MMFLADIILILKTNRCYRQCLIVNYIQTSLFTLTTYSTILENIKLAMCAGSKRALISVMQRLMPIYWFSCYASGRVHDIDLHPMLPTAGTADTWDATNADTMPRQPAEMAATTARNYCHLAWFSLILLPAHLWYLYLPISSS